MRFSHILLTAVVVILATITVTNASPSDQNQTYEQATLENAKYYAGKGPGSKNTLKKIFSGKGSTEKRKQLAIDIQRAIHVGHEKEGDPKEVLEQYVREHGL